MLTFIHKSGQKELIGRWIFDIGPFHVVRRGWTIRLLRQSKWNIKF